MKILYETEELVVAVKPAGVLSEEDGNKESAPRLLKEGENGKRRSEIYTVHRLDRDVGGVMVFAKTKSAASLLGRAVAARTIEKEYLAVLQGVPQEKEGTLRDLLFRDSTCGKTFVAARMRKGVREAILHYRVISEKETEGQRRALVLVKLETGRTHQIRVQFASRGLPLCGDGRYGGKESGKSIALFSYRLALPGSFDCREKPFEGAFAAFAEEISAL